MRLNQQTIGTCFFVRKSKVKNAQWPIFVRITVNKERKDFSTKEWINVKSWDEKHNRAKNTLPELRQLNTYLESIRSKIMQTYRKLQLDGKIHIYTPCFKGISLSSLTNSLILSFGRL